MTNHVHSYLPVISLAVTRSHPQPRPSRICCSTIDSGEFGSARQSCSGNAAPVVSWLMLCIRSSLFPPHFPRLDFLFSLPSSLSLIASLVYIL